MAPPLWDKVKNLFNTPDEAPPTAGQTVLRSSDSVTRPPPAAAPAPIPAPTLKKPDSLPPGQRAVAPNRAVKSSTVYPPGHVIAGRYKVERVFEGGMGYVYITQDRTQNLRFAIKQPKAMMLQVPDFFARVVREADAWTGLGMHPHIAYCYFVRNIEDVPHIFVEYVDGGTLQDWIADGKCLDYRVGLDLAIQCCHGMERAHRRGLLHRDLKPANILVTRDGLAKVTDFGLVGEATPAERRQVVGPARGETTYGMQMGTPEYMAPEQGRDPRRRSDSVPDGVWYDSDVYSFGLCLWEMVCGRLPFAHWAAHTGPPPEPREARRDLPASLRTLLLEVIALDRRQRPQDFAQLRERLNGIYRELFRQDAPHYRIPVLDTSAAELTNQGYSYYELGKRAEALACFRQAVEKDPTHPQAVYNLSLLQWRAGEIDDLEVLRRLENCSNNPENSAETLAELTAQVHAERSDPDAARECLEAYPGRYEVLFAGVEIRPIRCLRTLTVHTAVEALAMTGDGRRALSGSVDKTLRLWDLETGECLHTLTGHTSSIKNVAVMDSDRRALSGDLDGAIKLWDLETRTCLRTFGYTSAINAIAVIGDGPRVLLSGSGDRVLNLWDIETGHWSHTLTGHTDGINAVAVTDDGRWALSGSWDNTLKLWDLATRQCLRTLTGHPLGILAVVMTGNGQQALSGSWDIKLWESATGQCRRTLIGQMGLVTTVAMTPDGRQALLGGQDKTLKLWEITPWAYQAVLQVASPQTWTKKLQAHIALQKAQAQTDACLARNDFRGAYTALLTAWEEIGFRPDTALQDRYDRLICQGRITDFRVGYQEKSLTGHTHSIQAVAVTSNGRWALSGSEDGILKLWDLATGQCLRTLTEHTNWVGTVAMTGDGRRALSGSWDHTLKLWDLETGQCLRTLSGHTAEVIAVALTGDGRRALSGSWDHTLKLWDLETGQCLRTLTGHTDKIRTVAVTDDGRRALSGSSDKTLKLWDLETGKCLRTLTGHTDGVMALAMTGDGRRTLSGIHDGTLILWQLIWDLEFPDRK